jgi:Electron transfer flavoprotein, alpha subunit
MSALLIADHNIKEVKPFTLNAITAASQIDLDFHVFVFGHSCGAVAGSISGIPNVAPVIHIDDAIYAHYLPAHFSPVVFFDSAGYSFIVCSAFTFGCYFMPGIAALLDTSPVSDIIPVISADTFLRPIYAGDAFATVCSTDVCSCITIRPTSFDPAPPPGGTAEIVQAVKAEASDLTKFF